MAKFLYLWLPYSVTVWALVLRMTLHDESGISDEPFINLDLYVNCPHGLHGAGLHSSKLRLSRASACSLMRTEM